MLKIKTYFFSERESLSLEHRQHHSLDSLAYFKVAYFFNTNLV